MYLASSVKHLRQSSVTNIAALLKKFFMTEAIKDIKQAACILNGRRIFMI